MTIPWGWIKQRPHFLAEELSDYFWVDVYYKKANHIIKYKERPVIGIDHPKLTISSFRIIPFHAIPIMRKMQLDFVNNILLRIQLPNLRKYDYIYIASPNLYGIIQKNIPKDIKVIYDCMDDYAEFSDVKSDRRSYDLVLKNERILLQNADYVICSAEYLKNKIFKRASIKSARALIVNNAIELPKEGISSIVPYDVQKMSDLLRSCSKSLVYVGAISEWFDFDTIIDALDADKRLNAVLIGPVIVGSGVVVPKHDRLHVLGSVQRQYIFHLMELATVLVMPFKVMELVKSVNPVKLYEYIYTGKPVIASRYSETEKFSEYVHLYSTSKEFIDIINSIVDVPVPNDYIDKCRAFINQNTWKERASAIADYICDK